MGGETTITMIGNLTATPELRYMPSGVPVVNFTVASTPRTFRDGEWREGDPVFLRCSAWRDLAEQVAESLEKGMRIIVNGRLRHRIFEVNGERRSTLELEVDDVGPSLKSPRAKAMKAEQHQPRSTVTSTYHDSAENH